jgi:hypothetical protein
MLYCHISAALLRKLPNLKILDTSNVDLRLKAEPDLATAGVGSDQSATTALTTDAPVRLSQMTTASVLAALATTSSEVDPTDRAVALRRQLHGDGIATLHSIDALCTSS